MKKRRCLCSLIFMFIIMTMVCTANITYADGTSTQSSADIPSSWAKTEVDKAIAVKLLPEQLQSAYRSNITREEFCEIAVNLYEDLSGKQAVRQGDNPFTDTQNDKVIIANSLGIVDGVGNNRFAPNNEITRQEISVMLYRTMKVAKPNGDYSITTRHIFADNAKISTWAREAVSYMYSAQIINGVGDNQFKPLLNTSREQASILALRIHENALNTTRSLATSRGGTSRLDSVMQSRLAALIAPEMGKPYQWGAEGPDSFDCSGLVYYLYGKLGIALPRVSRDQATVGLYVPKEELAYGDLVFFARDGKTVNHVGIYVGNGEFVNAPSTGDVVKKSSLASGYYQTYYFTARRVIFQ